MRISLLFIFLAGSMACRDAKPADLTKRRAPAGLPPSTATAPSAPGAPAPAVEPGAVTLSGKILERIDAPPYSYLRIGAAAGEQWAAVNQTGSSAGETVSISGTMMDGFESKTLNRRFEKIVFGQLVGAATPSAPADPGKAHTTSPVTSDVKVALADGPGATSIAGLFANRAALAGQQVAVRGKVVKLNSGIMGKTWLHLQDGSGSPATSDHDLAVTTTSEVKLDDVVTVRGQVHLDRDFGAGYSYSVIVEDAKVEH